MGLVKRNGARWFREELFPDVAMEFKVDRVIANLRTRDAKGKPLQHLQVLGTPRFGRVLGLDGITQTTEGDEAYYHEAVVHCAANSCARPPKRCVRMPTCAFRAAVISARVTTRGCHAGPARTSAASDAFVVCMEKNAVPAAHAVAKTAIKIFMIASRDMKMNGRPL